MQALCDLHRLLHGVSNLASCHLNAKALHRMLKLNTILATLDRIDLNTDYLYIVPVKYALLCKLRAKIQS